MSYTVAVRAMCEFTAKRGDLDLRFTPAPTALEGMAGHALVASRRGSQYESEIPLSGSHGLLQVRGRADGYDPALNRLEEVKTYRGALDKMPANHRALHWAQARVYGHLLCRERGLAEVELALVYFDVASQQETLMLETRGAAELEAFFVEQCGCFLDWAAQEAAHRLARDAALQALAFPHGAFRAGQRELAVAVYRTVRDGRCLMVQAPTGIGKTVGTLFPMLKACPGERLDKVFFLSAKGPGRALALHAVDTLRAGGELPLRTLELVARDKACEHPDKACHGEACPLARGFYDRLPQARAAALAGPTMDRAAVREAALAHGVCPYYLSQELVRWSDVIVGDYNYYFDGSAMLHGLTLTQQWRVGVLVDEAHNLVDRARGMYTATLVRAGLRAARHSAPAAVRKALDSLSRSWGALERKQTQPYAVLDTLPAGLLSAMFKAVEAINELMTESPLALEEPLLRFYFEVLHFARLAEQFGPHSLFDVTLEGSAGSVLCLRNVVPAPFLAPRYATARAVVLFSGTLQPEHFYRDTLGLPTDTPWLDVAAPFRAEQLTVRVVGSVSTRWRDREQSLRPIVELIAAQYAERPGNYLGFLSSFDYLQQVAALLRERHPELPVWMQTPGMDEAGRADFLARFTPESRGVGFAVLGGAFSEGVDLPGARLIGAFIATLGLPQMNPVNEQMKRTLHAKFGRGYDYAYLYPGLQKVVQAAGRVIRTESDTGTVHLIDDRYRRRDVQRLLPAWWRLS